MEFLNNITIFIFGASIGSFLNVLIDRLPKNESINGRSHCDHCRKKLVWYDLIPVISFFILGGKCRYCKKKLSFQYPLVEVITGLSFLTVVSFRASEASREIFFLDPSTSLGMTKDVLGIIVTLGIISCLIVIFFSDLKYHLISDYILLALFIFSLLSKIVIPAKAGIQSINISLDPLLRGGDILSGLIVALPIFLIYFLSKERAMGLGDVYLTAIIGFLLGWKAGFIALYIAFITGAFFGLIAMILRNKKMKSKIAFGPFLVIGTIIMLFYGDKVWQLISSIYKF